jgi:hypothetical protein
VARKLLRLTARYHVEVGGLAISAPGNPWHIEDVVLVPQVRHSATVDFDDAGLAAARAKLRATGRPFDEWGRMWIHSQPDGSEPSGQDFATFGGLMAFAADTWRAASRLGCDPGPLPWHVMLVLGASDRSCSAHLRAYWPTIERIIDVELAASLESPTEEAEWLAEYALTNLQPPPPPRPPTYEPWPCTYYRTELERSVAQGCDLGLVVTGADPADRDLFHDIQDQLAIEAALTGGSKRARRKARRKIAGFLGRFTPAAIAAASATVAPPTPKGD